MKILLDGRLISNKPTGISRYIYEIINIYQEKFGYDEVYVLVNDSISIVNKNFNYIETKYKPYNIFDFFLISFFLNKINFDIYHSLFYSNSFFKKKKTMYITTVHDLMYRIVDGFFGGNFFKNFLGRKYYDFIVRKSLKNSDYIITVSETTKKDVKKIFNKNSVLIPEGISNISTKKEKKSEIKEKSYFLYVGNSRPHKNLTFLISSFKKAKTNYELIIVGTNNKILVNDEKIKVLGFITEEELNWLYENSVAFIFPSKYEGFGLPVLEALSRGTKVICSTGGALKEFSEKLVFYFEPTDAEKLTDLIEKIDNLEKDEKQLTEELKKYNWENIKIIMNNYIDIWLK